MNFPETIRNIAIVGSLHHGKTSFLDMLISESHSMKWDTEKPTRYTDVHMIERERGVSIKSMPMSLVMQNLKGKSYLCNFMDTPGHLNFSDEVSASLRICDGAILVLDVIDGVTPATEQLIKHLATQKIPLFLVVNKIDRLIIELKIPPIDAYFKIKHAIEQVNSILATFSPLVRLSPEADNVCFSSSRFGFCFSLRSFAMMYAKKSSSPIDIDAFARRLWGDIFFDVEKRNFRKTQTDEASKRSFLHFILEPIYKLHAQVIGEDPKSLGSVLATVGIHMKKSELLSDVKPLLATVCRSFFGDMSSVIEMCVSRIPNPLESSHVKVSQSYTGPTDSKYVAAMNSCDPNGPLMIQIVKFYNAENVESFEAFGRVMSGTIKSNQTVRVLGEGYSPDDEEDMAVHQVSGISIFESRYKVKVTRVPAGNWVLLAGVDSSIIKSATITDNSADEDDPVFIFSPLKFFSQAVMKIAVEPVQPTDLPKMLEGLRKISKSYPILETKVEESGEHILLGPGELYLDSAMHDLRKLYSEIDVKVADPVVKFCETIVETSAMKCSAETPNKKNKITMICEPLEKGIAEDIESKKVDIKWPAKELGRHFMDNYEWDILAARNIWAFGPEESGPNVLINDTLPSETDKKLLFSVKDSIKQGFQWGTREGPLTDERNLI
jgi:U5 small nuclear ribonucleoprotein component